MTNAFSIEYQLLQKTVGGRGVHPCCQLICLNILCQLFHQQCKQNDVSHIAIGGKLTLDKLDCKLRAANKQIG